MLDIFVCEDQDSQRQRIVEITLNYPLDHAELLARQSELAGAVDKLAQELTALPVRERLQAAAQAVLEAGELDPLGGSTAYDLFIDGSADSEGLSLAFAALCQRLELPCQTAQGTLEESPRFWVAVQTREGWRHLDLAASDGEELPLYTDLQLQELGYMWDSATLPPCV